MTEREKPTLTLSAEDHNLWVLDWSAKQVRIVMQSGEEHVSPISGRPSTDALTIVNAIRYRAHYGLPWRELPPSFGPWQTAARRCRQLVLDGRWERIVQALGEN